MSYVEASDISLRKTGQIKLHGQNGFAGMRKAGNLVAKCLDDLTDVVKPCVPTSRISTLFSRSGTSRGTRLSAGAGVMTATPPGGSPR